jgi:hypothetical protein
MKTPAEDRFKAAVVSLIVAGVYPSPTPVCQALGWTRRRRELNGREAQWRIEALEGVGWVRRADGSGHWSPGPESGRTAP